MTPHRPLLGAHGMQMNVEQMSDHLAKPLNQVRNQILAGFNDTERKAYIHLVDWLRANWIAN